MLLATSGMVLAVFGLVFGILNTLVGGAAYGLPLLVFSMNLLITAVERMERIGREAAAQEDGGEEKEPKRKAEMPEPVLGE